MVVNMKDVPCTSLILLHLPELPAELLVLRGGVLMNMDTLKKMGLIFESFQLRISFVLSLLSTFDIFWHSLKNMLQYFHVGTHSNQ